MWRVGSGRCEGGYGDPAPSCLQYDNVVMEEAAQILEVETFIPMMLQKPEDGYSRLKRVVLIGDHHQVRKGRGNRGGEGATYGRRAPSQLSCSCGMYR